VKREAIFLWCALADALLFAVTGVGWFVLAAAGFMLGAMCEAMLRNARGDQ
jgi:hypothetical protein